MCARSVIHPTVLLHKDFVLKRFCIPPPLPPIGNGITWPLVGRKYGSVGYSDVVNRDDRVTRKVEEKGKLLLRLFILAGVKNVFFNKLDVKENFYIFLLFLNFYLI